MALKPFSAKPACQQPDISNFDLSVQSISCHLPAPSSCVLYIVGPISTLPWRLLWTVDGCSCVPLVFVSYELMAHLNILISKGNNLDVFFIFIFFPKFLLPLHPWVSMLSVPLCVFKRTWTAYILKPQSALKSLSGRDLADAVSCFLLCSIVQCMTCEMFELSMTVPHLIHNFKPPTQLCLFQFMNVFQLLCETDDH